MQELAFAFLLTLLGGEEPLELGMGQLPDGRAVVVALTAGPENTTVLHSFIQTEPGNFTASGFQHVVLDSGSIFGISPQLVSVAGYLYMAAVCNFNACMYRLPIASLIWQGAHLLTNTNNIHSASIALISFTLGTLALTMQTSANELVFYQMYANVAILTALSLLPLYAAISNVASPFNGGQIAKSAFDPETGNSCHIYRERSVDLLGNLVATCFIASVVSTVILQTMTNSPGFVPHIETRALFYAGAFYFMYFLAGGDVRLAKLQNPSLAVQIITLGTVALAAGFPGMALAVGYLADNPYLFAFWPGNAVQITLATLAVTVLQNFPITNVGPIAALFLLALTTFSLFIVGSGSIVGTVLTDAPVAPVAVPLLGGPWTIVLVVMLAMIAVMIVRRRRRRAHES